MTKILALESNVPANNVKIIEIFNKLRAGQISVNTDYQRKLVWKKQHKLDFIETILKNYPFPEIYLAPRSLDPTQLILIDEIVDGQQRLTTIQNYINGVDVFADQKTPLIRFDQLDVEEKLRFLNYEISVRYLKNATADQIKEIFQRINKTDYALNKIERLNAKWGESEFVCFCKQIIDRDFETAGVQYLLTLTIKIKLLDFFHGENEESESVFSLGDSSRMLALQYIMTLVATMASNEYFHRNDKVERFIETFNDVFPQAKEIEDRLSKLIDFIDSMEISRRSRWFNKANLFSLMIELDQADRSMIIPEILGAKLMDLDYRATLAELGLENKDAKLSSEEIKYLDLARESVNQKSARESRAEFLQHLFEICRI